jgi:glycerophosphoryl diester phosphodiesterase
MNFRAFAFLLGAALLPLDCEQSAEVAIPAFPDGGLLRTGMPLSRKQLRSFEGMFVSSQGSELLGGQMAVRTSPGTVSVLTDKNAGFAVLGGACLPDRSVVVEGYWQYPTRVEAGLVRLFVEPKEFSEAFCNGEAPEPTTAFTLKGFYGHDSEFPRSPLALSWSHELKPWRGRFFTIAHHGACENTDHCGASPNSLESIRLAERVGSNAAELDVRVTKDGFPVLFHDPGLSKSLVQGLFCNGQVADLSLVELLGSCELRYGELIPTVEEALDMMVDETELEGVYLDIKVPEAIEPTARIVSRLTTTLRNRNENDDPDDDRAFTAVVAITKEDQLETWHATKAALSSEGLEVPPCLVEFDPDVAVSEKCIAWSPTWTEGPQVENVERVRAAGVGIIFWTINQSEFIDQFLELAHPNGIISARASLLFYRYQTVGTPPEPRKAEE